MPQPQGDEVVLVCEHPDDSAALVEILAPFGRPLVSVASSRALFERLEHTLPLAIVVVADPVDADIYQLTNRLLSHVDWRELPVLALRPSLTDRRLRLQGDVLKTIDCLPLPVDIPKLNQWLMLVQSFREVRVVLRGIGDAGGETPEAILAVNREGRIVYGNAAARRYLRLSPGRLWQLPLVALLEEPVARVLPTWEQHGLRQEVVEKALVQRPRLRMWTGDGHSLQVNAVLVAVSFLANTELMFAFRPLEGEQEVRDRMTRLSQVDALTGLASRARLEESLTAALELVRETRQGLAVLLFDLDHFSNVNDTLGFALGDQVLRAAADRVRYSGLPGLLARAGGDVFAFLSEEDTDERGAVRLAHQLRALFRAPFLVQGHELFCAVSIGIALHPSCGTSAPQLLQHAEVALSRAKQLGGNTVQFYSAQMNRHGLERLELEAALHHAVYQRELAIRVQPVLQADGLPVALAVLPYWRHGRQQIDGERLLELVRSAGLTQVFGDWLLEAVFRCYETLVAAGCGSWRFLVDLEPRYLQEEPIRLRLKGLAATYQMPLAQLWLVVPETEWRGERGGLLAIWQELARLGVGWMLGSFGTDIRILNQLEADVPVSLRLDAGLLAAIAPRSPQAVVVRGLLAMARDLGREVLIAGIDEDSVATWLSEVGGDWFQGAVVAPVLDGAGLLDWCRGQTPIAI